MNFGLRFWEVIDIGLYSKNFPTYPERNIPKTTPNQQVMVRNSGFISGFGDSHGVCSSLVCWGSLRFMYEQNWEQPKGLGKMVISIRVPQTFCPLVRVF